MIYSVNGIVAEKLADTAVIECAGVGYACRTSIYTLSALETGSTAKLYTYLHITQDNAELFGFADKKELGCFKMLITVSGVGPKVALSVLSGMDAGTFAITVATGDHKALTRIKGVGPKMAQRIVLELRDKLKGEHVSAGNTALPVKGAASDEAVRALMVLGFSEAESERAVSAQDQSLPVEEIIKASLRSLAG
ncbi:MAG: Holliday junction branch migration protein RuvA [Oscillospiraceae bacterium]|nr:Holliday junction branch migration protein RuvA [Oscillospiraceae bacterium]